MKSKIISLPKAIALRNELRAKGKKVVFTNGCFDIIHAGHARYLAVAKKCGDYLVVGLNSDASVKRLKGPGRPIMPFSERALLLSFLAPVDLVVGFNDDTPIRLINALKPDVLAKGADYKISEIIGANEVKSWGGKVRRIRLTRGISTSAILRKLQA